MEQLDVLREQMKNCGSCDLCHTRTQIVFGSGSTQPQIMIIGEAPTDEEDAQGVPFVSKAGEKLDKILKYVGVTREDVYITNAVLCRTPNNRDPRGEELNACKWRLDLQISLLKPQLIIVLGRVAMHQFMGEPIKGALSKYFPENIKGEWLNYGFHGHVAKVLVTYHPSYHLRSPERAYHTTLPHWNLVKDWLEKNRRVTI